MVRWQLFRICLKEHELWHEFNRHGNEMIITRNGRCLFPLLRYTVNPVPLAIGEEQVYYAKEWAKRCGEWLVWLNWDHLYRMGMGIELLDELRWKFRDDAWNPILGVQQTMLSKTIDLQDRDNSNHIDEMNNTSGMSNVSGMKNMGSMDNISGMDNMSGMDNVNDANNMNNVDVNDTNNMNDRTENVGLDRIMAEERIQTTPIDPYATKSPSESNIENIYELNEGSLVTVGELLEKGISFTKIKLSNRPLSKGEAVSKMHHNQFCLSSFHRYQPVLYLFDQTECTNYLEQYGDQNAKVSLDSILEFIEHNDEIHPREKGKLLQKGRFEDTIFIAVTHYQNEKVTILKKSYNPHAKGFVTEASLATTEGTMDKPWGIQVIRNWDIEAGLNRVGRSNVELKLNLSQPSPKKPRRRIRSVKQIFDNHYHSHPLHHHHHHNRHCQYNHNNTNRSPNNINNNIDDHDCLDDCKEVVGYQDDNKALDGEEEIEASKVLSSFSFSSSSSLQQK